MALYYLLLLEVKGRPAGSNWSHLMRIGHGKYKNIVEDRIDKRLICSDCKNAVGEDL